MSNNKSIDLKSSFLLSISKINPDNGQFNSFLELLLKQIQKYYPDLIFQVQIFNPRKKNFKTYSVNQNKVEFKVVPVLDDSLLKVQEIFPIESITNQTPKRLYPLLRDNSHIGFIEVLGSSNDPNLNFDLIIAGQYIVRAMTSNEKKMAIESLVELNTELEKIVDEKTDSLLREKEAHFHASKMATLGEIAAGVAHEINNPLTIIQARVLTMEKKMEKKQVLDAELAEDFKKIISTVHRITKIIKGLKFISRDGQHDPPTKVLLSQLITESLDLCAERLKNSNVMFEVLNLNEDFEVEVRETQVVQVFLNLINNSFDAIKNLDDKWIKIDFQTNKEFLEIKFKDSGSGISEEILEKIMNPFFTTKPAGQGTGLGLSISKGIIENHAGRLYYNSMSINTEFIIAIPFVRKISTKPNVA